MTMKPLLSLIATLAISIAYSTAADAEEIDFKPKVSQENTSLLFKEAANFETRQLIIKFKNDITIEEKHKLLETMNASEKHNQTQGNFSLATLPKGTNLKRATEQLMYSNHVEYVEPNYQLTKQYDPSDQYYNKQWYLTKIGMPEAWNSNLGSPGIIVAVIDGGVQVTHPDLASTIVKPYNAVTGGASIPADSHGTHVAGIIGAATNYQGTTGIAPRVKIMPINVFSSDKADSYSIADGIIYAVDAGADVINLSLTTDEYPGIVDYAVKYAASKGVLVVAAAGNEHIKTPQYPAALNSVLGVSAVDSRDQLAYFSNYGSYIDFAAPGVSIYSTVAKSSYNYMSGTSMASPVVSGISALVLSKNPFLKPSEVITILKNSSIDLGPAGRDNEFGYGRVDAKQALEKTPEAMSAITLSDQTLIENASNKVGISFEAHKNTKISMYVENSHGKVIASLLKDKTWNGGTVTYNWDGKLDSNAYAPNSKLKIVAKASNKKHSLTKSTYLSVKDEVLPSAEWKTSSATFSPAVKTKIAVPFYLNKNANVTAEIRNSSGNTVTTIMDNTLFYGGTRSIDWNGKNSSGARVKDGSYTLHLTAIDKNGNQTPEISMPITIDTTAPKATLTKSASVFKMNGKTLITAKIHLYEKTNVSVNVIDSKGKTIKKLVVNKSFSGNITSSWNGKTSGNTFAKEGSYRFQLIIADYVGNNKTLLSSPFKLVDIRK
jgi:subtilisin family serine protease/flagellar hook assembly protein FlgD